ncbi:hypothetical protein ACJMK2_033821 [Sinanodonta woodiana]|uniref:G-protein coupled receptors family 1 profile domain-containing protein n=1 Tax=Sinanodonta woodiana TaxID=1069815 RepID=A0ABD3WT30_SINWO
MIYNSTFVNDSDSVTSQLNTETDEVSTNSVITESTTVLYQPWLYGTISKEQYNLNSFVLFEIIIPIICIVGLVGNLASVALLYGKPYVSSFYFFLRALTVSDAVVLFIGLLRSIIKIIEDVDPWLGRQLDIFSSYFLNAFLGPLFSKIASSIIAIMSIERFMAILRPLKAKEMVFVKYPARILAITIIIQLLFHAPTLVWLQVVKNADLNNSTYIYRLEYASWANVDVRRYFTYFVTFFNLILPVVIVIVMNSGIVILFLLAKRRRLDMTTVLSTKDNEQRTLTVTLIIIGLFYVLSLVPAAFVFIMSATNSDFKIWWKEHYLLGLIVDITILCITINSASDFLIYNLSSKRFRQLFIRRFVRPSCCTSDGLTISPRKQIYSINP